MKHQYMESGGSKLNHSEIDFQLLVTLACDSTDTFKNSPISSHSIPVWIEAKVIKL